jgi:OTT_1508-like deaminase
MLLEQFSTNELPFFYDDLHVGGTKPSCYCCNLFRFHGGDIVTRPIYGNVWSKWHLPPGTVEENGRLDWNTKVIVKRMTERVRLDLLHLIETDMPRRARLKDSTSGNWTAPT